MSISDRKKIISELQNLAEEVLKLKSEHRQKRPIVIEFSGSPKAGKTSSINSLALFLKRNGFKVRIISEGASICPVSDKKSPMFNIWTACVSLSNLIGTLEDKDSNIDVLILDRGIFDSLCWFEWLTATNKMEEIQRNIVEQFILMDDLVKNIDIVFIFCVDPDVSIEREYATLLTDKPGTIMNKDVLREYLGAIDHTMINRTQFFHSIFKIDTFNKSLNAVGKEVTMITLETLKDLLMEKIGFFEVTNELEKILKTNTIFKHKYLTPKLPQLKFDLRQSVEDDLNRIQIIPIAVFVDSVNNKVLVVKKNKNAVTDDSPEKDKILLYVGGHTRFEDQTDAISEDFLSVCKMTLRREIKEELGISIALNGIEPFYIYTPSNTKSKKHLAVCFLIEVNADAMKLKLDPHELILTKGKSKSGKFLKIDDIVSNYSLEDWSITILEYCFKVNFNHGQMSFFGGPKIEGAFKNYKNKEYFDFIADIEYNTRRMIEEVTAISQEMNDMSSSVTGATNDINQAKCQSGNVDAIFVRNICRKLSEPIALFVQKLNAHVVAIRNCWSIIEYNYWYFLDNEYTRKSENIKSIKYTIVSLKGIRNSMSDSDKEIKVFIHVLYNSMGLEHKLNNAVTALISEFDEYLSMTKTIKSSINKIIEKCEIVMDELNEKW